MPQSDFNQLFNKNKYDDNFSLTTLIQNLFNLNSDISDYEQPRNDKNTSDDSNKNSDKSTQNEPASKSSKQDKVDNQKHQQRLMENQVHQISKLIHKSQINLMTNLQMTTTQIISLHPK